MSYPRPGPTFGGTPIVSSAQRKKAVSLPLAGTAASPKLHGLVGVLAQQRKRAGGIIKHNTNAVKNLTATQAVPGDNVDEDSSPEPPAKKAKQPAKPAAGVPARGRGGDWGQGGRWGVRIAGRAAVAAAGAREQQAGRRLAVPAETGCKSFVPPAHCRTPCRPLPRARSLAVPRARYRVLGQSAARLSGF
eukprot:jgi/Tetstr1/443338/TSEL_031353.t1